MKTTEMTSLGNCFLSTNGFSSFNSSEYTVFPGFCDVHVHFREPGFSYKETIKGGSEAAAAGGYTAVMTMPNLSPAPDTRENLEVQLKIIKKDSKIPIFPYATITMGEMGEALSDMDALSEHVLAFSDDGRGVQSDNIMYEAMEKAARLGKIISAHCEDNSLLFGGYIHAGEYARKHSHRGISSESEYKQIERDIALAKKTGVKYHVCHISTKESVALIRQAKAEGVNISCETAPHYLTLDESNLIEDGRFKMNPPLRTSADREALLEGLIDGTVDMIATDHAPHTKEEKSRGLEKSAMGICGLQTAFPVLYTKLVKSGALSLERLIEAMSIKPRERFKIGTDAGFCVFKLDEEYKIDPEKFKGKGKSTPFENMTVFSRCILTLYGNEAVYLDI